MNTNEEAFKQNNKKLFLLDFLLLMAITKDVATSL